MPWITFNLKGTMRIQPFFHKGEKEGFIASRTNSIIPKVSKVIQKCISKDAVNLKFYKRSEKALLRIPGSETSVTLKDAPDGLRIAVILVGVLHGL